MYVSRVNRLVWNLSKFDGIPEAVSQAQVYDIRFHQSPLQEVLINTLWMQSMLEVHVYLPW